MAPKSIFPSSPLSLETIKLGRLVLNTRHPQQDFIDPTTESPEVTRNALLDFEEIRSSARASSLRSRLANLLSMTLENRDHYQVDFSAAMSYTYLLNNSRRWFNRACGAVESRKWLEAAIENGNKVYLVVGYHTLVDARVTERGLVAENEGFKAGAQIAGAGVPGVGGIDFTTDVSAGNGRGDMYQRVFATPGEHIYAVQYRKVQFNWYSSRSIKSAFLEPNNRWKPCIGVRGEVDDGIDDVVEVDITEDWNEEEEGDEGDEDGDEDEDEDDEDEDKDEDEDGNKESDIVNKSGNLGEKYVTESGEIEFIF